MPPKKKGDGKGPLKKKQTSEVQKFPEIPHLLYSLERNSLMMMMMMMMMKRIFGMWSLAIHRAYREDSDLSLCWAHMRFCRNRCAPAHMSYGGNLRKLAAQRHSYFYRCSKIR